MADEEGGQCRICFSGVHDAPRGLADLLVEPCGCAGTQALVHLSCLHAWRLQQLQTRGSAQRCSICRQRYRVPADTWRAAALAEVIDMRELQLVEPQQGGPSLMQFLVGAAALVFATGVTAGAAFMGAGVVAGAGALCMADLTVVGMDPTYAGEAAAAVAPTAVHPAVASVALAVTSLGAGIAAQYLETDDWDAVRQSGGWRLAVRVAKLASILGLLLCTLRLVSADRSAPGAPSQQPVAEASLEACISIVRGLLAANVAVINLPLRLAAWCVGRQHAFLEVARAALAAGVQDMEAAELAGQVMQAFKARPAALRALHAVLRPSVLQRVVAWCAGLFGR